MNEPEPRPRSQRARPHDLLLVDPAAVRPDGPDPLPDWAARSLHRTPWVVVRRAADCHDAIPVGIRGTTRRERAAAWLRPDGLSEVVGPEALRLRIGDLDPDLLLTGGALQVDALLTALRLEWGPTGSVGYTLATGRRVAHGWSDLDLLIRAADRLDQATWAELDHSLAGLHCRVDAQLETPAGGVSLTEHARRRANAPLLVRTGHGPVLLADPWASEEFLPAARDG